MTQMRGIIASTIYNAAVPALLYHVLIGQGWTEIHALMATAVVPAAGSVYTLLRRHTIDLIGGLVFAGVLVSIVAALLGGNPRLMLLRESLLTLALGVACFISLVAAPRPLMFYFGRYFSAGNDPAKQAEYEALWQYPSFRHSQRLITLVWGCCYCLELGLKVLMVYTLSIQTVLVVSPIVSNTIVIGTIAWTFAYAGRLRKRAGK